LGSGRQVKGERSESRSDAEGALYLMGGAHTIIESGEAENRRLAIRVSRLLS
jgi:hypothetical protein